MRRGNLAVSGLNSLVQGEQRSGSSDDDESFAQEWSGRSIGFGGAHSLPETLDPAIHRRHEQPSARDDHAVPDGRAVELGAAGLLAGVHIHKPELRATLAIERG